MPQSGHGAASPERLRDDLARLLHRGSDVRDFSFGAARILARAVPFDGVRMVTMDPASHLPTGDVVEHGLPPAATAAMAEIWLARAGTRRASARRRRETSTAACATATSGGPTASATCSGSRWSATMRRGAGLTLLRAGDRHHFVPADTGLLRAMAPDLAEGLRRAMLLTALPEERDDDDGESAVLALLAADNSVTLADARPRCARRAGREEPGPSAPAGGHRRGGPGAQHRPRACGGGRRRPGASPHGVRALAARARLDARRRRRHADCGHHRARPSARAGAPHRRRLRPHRTAPRLADGAPVGSEGWFAPVTAAKRPRPPTRSA
jgi:hypothetical protein